jgi:hypothetical protein
MNTKKKNSLHVPVTHGLKDMYAMDMHLAYKAASLGQFNVIAFSRLAAAMSVILSALTQHGSNDSDALAVLNSAVETMQSVRNRGDSSDIWEINASELPVVLSGIEMAEQCMGTLNVALLEQTAKLLLEQLYGDQKSS